MEVTNITEPRALSHLRGDRSVKNLGLFIGFLFCIAGSAKIAHAIITGYDSNVSLVHPSVSYYLFLGIFFLLTAGFDNKWIKFFHISLLLGTGFFASITSNSLLDIQGEFILIVGFVLTKKYGCIKKNFIKILVVIILFTMLLRFVLNLGLVVKKPNEFTYYILLVSMITIFFLILMDTENSKKEEEASIICEQWAREQVYNDIGRSVFSTFMHDYHVDSVLVYLETLEELIDTGDIYDAKNLITELKELLSLDSKNITRIKEQIRLSEKSSPELLDCKTIIKDKIDYFKRAYSLTDIELNFYYYGTDEFRVYMTPMDFVGVLENLVKNAIDAGKGLRNIKVLLKVDPEKAVLTVINKGPMIPWRNPDGTVPLESFRVGRTTKENGSGWGVYSIIKRVYSCGGEVLVKSINGETDFTLILPVKMVSNTANIYQKV